MLKVTTDKHEASRGLSATAELLVYDNICSLTTARHCSKFGGVCALWVLLLQL